ncbi:hypothetical protein [Acetobacterium carbinolicum]|uniref:hypothetical protein n=1 Tax=Acetobacterium carbinolicum TaxID=52690 RepID=UPI0039C9DA4E
MKKNVVRILTAVLMLSVVFSSSVFAAEKEKSAWESFVGLFSGNAVTVADTQVDGVTYRTHIENDGWAQGWVSDGDMSGSEGRGLRLEGIEIKIEGNDLPDGLGVTYRTHIENDGWAQGWVSDGDMSGSEGRGLRLEGIEIKLTGENADDYTVLYRTHIENDGWAQGWVADGEMSGSEGRGLRLEGIEIKVEQKEADLTAYEAALAAVTEADYTAASWATYQEVVAANVVTEDNLQSEVDAATAAITAAQADLVKIPVVETVTATAPTVITITGTNLENLTAADIVVDGYDVAAYANGTVTLASALAPSADVNVDITIEGETTTYVVNYQLVVNTVEVVESTFDDDRTGQKVTIKVNGTLMNVDYLNLAGYDVKFVATKDAAVANIFTGASNTSATGELVAPLTVANYLVEVQLDKSGLSTVSDEGTIKVINIDGEVTTINSVEFGNGPTANIAYDGAYSGTAFKMNSKTLVAGETANIREILASVGGVEITVASADFEVESSNAAVISVNPTGYEMTANSRGTATITVTVGETTQAFTFTVVNDAREINKVTAVPSTAKGVVANAVAVEFTTLDQYGDPFAVATGDPGTASQVEEVIPNNGDGDAIVSDFELVTDVADSIGVATINVTGAAVGVGTVYFKDADSVSLGTLGVNITDNNAVATKKLELVTVTGQSEDNSLELTDDDKVSYKLALYNAGGYYVAAGDFTAATGDYVATSADTTIATVAVDAGNESFTITGLKEGTVDVVITERVTSTYVGKVTITVTNNPYEITGVSFKSVGTIDYTGKTFYAKDVLDIVASTDDDVVNGITLSKASASKVRIAESIPVGYAGTIIVNDLYLDLDNDGEVTAGDVDLGTLAAFTASDVAGTFTVNDYTVAAYTTNAIVGPTASGYKGTVLVKVMTDPTDPTTAISGTSFYIDVE